VVPKLSGASYGGGIWAPNLFVGGFPCTPLGIASNTALIAQSSNPCSSHA